MIALEITALLSMAIVFVVTFARSAISHTRAVAWQTPPAHAPFRPVTIATADGPSHATAADGVVVDAADRFRARRVRNFIEDADAAAA